MNEKGSRESRVSCWGEREVGLGRQAGVRLQVDHLRWQLAGRGITNMVRTWDNFYNDFCV